MTTEVFRKQSPAMSFETNDEVAKRIATVDTLGINKEKKLLFDKIDNSEEYYPFGTPGCLYFK